MNKMYRVSDFCHFLEVSDDAIAVYNSLNLGVLFVDKVTALYFINAVGGIIDYSNIDLPVGEKDSLIQSLLARRLIYPLGERCDMEDYLKMQNLLKDDGISVLYLLTTDGCNLGCKYCYIENVLPKHYSFSMMEEETAVRALDLFAAKVSKMIEEPKVIVYGGEPLLNMPIVIKAIDYFNAMKVEGRLPQKASLTINTNATLIDETFLDFIQGKEVGIAVSLDGTKDMHNAMRMYKDGEGTFDRVVESCEMMTARKIRFGFSVTVTRANINYMEEVLLWMCEKFNVSSIGFNIVVHQTDGILGMTEEEYGKLVTQKLINCFKICRERGVYEDRIMRKVEAFVNGYPYTYDCGAPGDQYVVSPEGLVGVCQAYCGDKRYFVQMDEIDSPSSRQIWRNWQFRSPLYQSQCYQCISLGICGGGCPYNAELKTGSIWGIDETFCIHSKGTVEFLIKDLYQQTIKS